jgi:hypothetical protein
MTGLGRTVIGGIPIGPLERLGPVGTPDGPILFKDHAAHNRNAE